MFIVKKGEEIMVEFKQFRSLEEIKNMHEEINSLNAQISDLRSEEK